MSDELWKEDPLAADCPWGGIGNYHLLDDLCEWDCPWRKSCIAIRNKTKQTQDSDLPAGFLPMKELRELKEKKEAENKCPECGYDGAFDVYESIGGCEGEVTKIHCPNCDAIFDPRIHWTEEAEHDV